MENMANHKIENEFGWQWRKQLNVNRQEAEQRDDEKISPC